MKLYVLPIGSACNANCPYCITKFRRMKNAVLSIEELEKVLASSNYDKIEITGGGEPSLHPEIEQIVKICVKGCPVNIYTNGNYNPTNSNQQICLSRAHYDDVLNNQIMGVKYDIQKYKNIFNLKLSLMLHKNGICTLAELEKYLTWAQQIAIKVVVRQLFEYEDENYRDYFAREYVSSVDMAEAFGVQHDYKLVEGNYFFNVDGLVVEFEGRSCACEDDNPVLGADGVLRNGWSEL